MKVVLEYIPLLSVIILTLLSNDIKNIWFTSLGKIFAIILIIFYSRIDKYIGLGVCMIIIMFYNTYDFYVFEGLENSEDAEDEETEDEETANLIEESESQMKDYDNDELQEEVADITGEEVADITGDIQNKVNENKKLELDSKKQQIEFDLEKQKIDAESKRNEKNDNIMLTQLNDQKTRREIETLQNILKNRKNYSNGLIKRTEQRLNELLFNDESKTEPFVEKKCVGCANTTLNKIETFANLIPKLTRI
jgi:hypothetical protein